jgi:hypothetical protein
MEFVSWDDEIPSIWKIKKRSKPPIRILSSHLLKCELTKFIGHFHQEKQCDQEKGGQNLRNIGLSEKMVTQI